MKQKITLFVLAFLTLSTVSFAQRNFSSNLHDGAAKTGMTTHHAWSPLRPRHAVVPAQNSMFRSLDTKQGLDSLVVSVYDANLAVWMPGNKEWHVYDADGHETLFTLFYWDTDLNDWMPNGKTGYEYDADGRLSVDSSFYFDSDSAQWFVTDKNVYTYDADGKLMEKDNYYWVANTSQWEPTEQNLYSYNADGSIDVISTLYWTGSTWEDGSQEVYSYDGDGNLTEIVSSYWDGFSWQPDSRELFGYNADGQWTEYITQYWDFDLGQWANDEKEEYIYDAAGDVMENFTYVWDIVTQTWMSVSKLDLVHDTDYSAQDLLIPIVYEEDVPHFFTHKLDNAQLYNWDEDLGWEVFLNVDLYYSEYVFVGTSEPEAEELGVFPNPASDHISLQLPDDFTEGIFRVFDAQGRQVLVQELQGSGEISVAGLQSGLYFYTLGGDERKMYGKFVKE